MMGRKTINGHKVEKCDNWDGKDNVCDIDRCGVYIKRTGGKDNPKSCYHRPLKIDGEPVTVMEAIEILSPELYQDIVEGYKTE